jgi:hypothetical protein
MAKEKRSEEFITNLDWDSPPNNKFTPWPIELDSSKSCSGEAVTKNQGSGKSSQKGQGKCQGA